MATKGLFPLIDRVVGGDLAERLGDWRRSGLSFSAIALRLHDDFQVDVNDETVRRWIRELEAVA